MDSRLPAGIEAGALMRRAQESGGFAAVLQKGDPDRGSILLVLRNRGTFFGVLQRELAADFQYQWSLSRSGTALTEEKLQEIVARRQETDPDSWLIELDIADPERFVAETSSSA